MTPIDIRMDSQTERDKKMMEEVQAFIDADVNAAELWKDENVGTGRNIDLYKRTLRWMRVTESFEMCQLKGKVIIKKKKA